MMRALVAHTIQRGKDGAKRPFCESETMGDLNLDESGEQTEIVVKDSKRKDFHNHPNGRSLICIFFPKMTHKPKVLGLFNRRINAFHHLAITFFHFILFPSPFSMPKVKAIGFRVTKRRIRRIRMFIGKNGTERDFQSRDTLE